MKGKNIKPSLLYMKGGGEPGDVFTLKGEKQKYLGNNRSDFERFFNDFWLTVERHDYLFPSTLFFFVFACLQAISWKIAGPILAITGVMAILLFIFIIIYGGWTFVSSMIDFVKYKIEYRKFYKKWVNGEIKRRFK